MTNSSEIITNDNALESRVEEFRLKEYAPIDYRVWKLGEAARRGENILQLLTEEERTMWLAAYPQQDMRDDPGQGEMVTYFGIQLLKWLPADRSVVVPACIFHDTGWYACDPDEWKRKVTSGDTEGEATRRPHQNRSIMFAGRHLGTIGYDLEKSLHIADIIGDHDTRKISTTPEGQVMRDADFLWRITYPHLMIYMQHMDPAEALAYMNKICLGVSPPHKMGNIAERISRVEAVNTLLYRFGVDAFQTIHSAGYGSELSHVLQAYRDMVPITSVVEPVARK